MTAKVLEFRLPAPAVEVRCPDCRGRGCQWCRGTGRWQDVTADKAAGLARLLAHVGQLERAADYYRSKACALGRAPVAPETD